MYSRRIQLFFHTTLVGVLFLAALVACGSSKEAAIPASAGNACSGTYNGTWNGNTGGVAILGTDCSLTISLTGACTSTGTYQRMLGSFGSSEFTVTSLSGTSPCLNIGEHRCSYVFSGSQFSVNCGSGDYVFYR